MATVEDHLYCKRLEWLGRLTRMGGDRIVRRVQEQNVKEREEEEDPGGCLTNRRQKI